MSNHTDFTAIVNGTAWIGRTMVPHAVVLVREGRIAAAGSDVEIPDDAALIDATDRFVVPGFIDILIHGSGGCLPETDAVGMARHVIQQGTTYFLPSLLSNELDNMVKAVDHVRSCVGPTPGGATIGGIHLEGPFLNPRYGGQRPETNIEPDGRTVQQLIDRCGNCLRMVTIAPERHGALAAITAFREAGATVSIGHSDATEEQYLAGRAAGITHATHLFNAMPPNQWPTSKTFLGIKTAGIEELILADDGISADIVCDATCAHVHPAMLRIAYRCKAPEKLSLVTDAMPLAGLPVGEQVLPDGQRLFTRTGEDVARLADGGLMGSAMSMRGALCNFMKHTGEPLASVLPMVSEAPARVLGIFDRKGSIAPGKDADLVLLDREVEVASVMIGGRKEADPLEG